MGYTLSTVLKNAILSAVIFFVGGLVAYGGIPPIQVLYATGLSAILTGLLSYERGGQPDTTGKPTTSTAIYELLPKAKQNVGSTG